MERSGDASGLEPQEAAWAAKLSPGTPPERLALLRNQPGVLVGEAEGCLWLRGNNSGSSLPRLAALIPIDAAFSAGSNDRLTPDGARLPTRRLPATCWTPIRDWLVPVVPEPLAPPPRRPPPLRFRLVPTPAGISPPNLILTTIERWLKFCEHASNLRLAPLSFAASMTGDVAVLGSPIPGLPGTAYHLDSQIAAPCGYEIEPRVPAAALARRLSLPPASLALFSVNGPIRILSGEDFVPASRSAARLTFEHLSLHAAHEAGPP